jgi:hypothetical protein
LPVFEDIHVINPVGECQLSPVARWRKAMTRILTRVLISLSLALPCSAAVEDQLAILEAAAQQDDHLQPGLKTYQVTGETP